MIVSPHDYQDELRPLSHDGSNGMPYIAHLTHGADLYLVLPFRQWNKKVTTTRLLDLRQEAFMYPFRKLRENESRRRGP
jgi:hypothetical protein